ncbi:MAG TPA: hypothetical protein VLX92_15910 [Kofleriaceae bacterium]|nr:hypothetical protein [Kofleriaceae bacterium]
MTLRLVLLAALAACNSSPHAAADAGGSGDAGPPVVLTGTPVVATAQLGTGDALLGTTADVVFDQVNGDTIFRARSNGTGLVQTPVDQIMVGWVQAETTNQLAANIAGWGLTEAALGADNTTRYMSMRAYQIDYYEDVDLTMPDKTAPPTAVYFVSKIYFGHSYEALFSGSESTFTAAVAATLPEASGSIMATAQSDNLMATNVGRGLVPTSGDAIFATSQSDVMADYTASGPSVPIFIEYRLVPGVAEPPGTTIPWQSAEKATIAIDEIDVFHNGAYLDLSNTAWTISASCSINGAVVDQNDPVWTDGSVTAGGSTVNEDGTGPQDPDTADPTSTYGRYAGLPWQKALPVADGNQLECDLAGERTDTSTPVALPPVVIDQTVDTASNVDGRAGNYDTGTSLDYQVHYTITYSAN